MPKWSAIMPMVHHGGSSRPSFAAQAARSCSAVIFRTVFQSFHMRGPKALALTSYWSYSTPRIVGRLVIGCLM
jgi:hypothetical protein